MLGFVSNLARAFEYAGDAAQLEALVRSLGDNIEKLLNLVTTSCIVILKYVRYSFAGKPRHDAFPFASSCIDQGRTMKPNDKKEIDRLQDHLNQLKRDVSQGVGFHIAHAVDEGRRNQENIGTTMEDLAAGESIRIPDVLCFSEGRCGSWTGLAGTF